MKTRILVTGVALAAMLGLAACAPTATSGDSAEPAQGGTLEYAINAQPGTGGLDPILASNQASAVFQAQIYEGLLTRDESGEIQPSLATDYEIVDELTYDFTIREGVKFSDGTDLTVDDVVFSFNTWNASTSSRKALIRGLATVEATDESTVRFTFTEPNGSFLNGTAGNNVFYVFSRAWYESTSEEDRQRSALGTGPFALSEWNDGVNLTLDRNEHYWGEDQPVVDAINFQIVPDESARLALVQQGSVDIASFTDAAVAQQAEDAGYTIGDAAYTRKLSVYLNPAEDSPLADVRIRQALSLSLDREQIVELATGGFGAVSLHVAAGDPAAPEIDQSTPMYTRDLDAAKALLEDAGYDGEPIELSYPSDYTTDDIPVFEVLQQQAADAGINVELVATPWADISRIFTYGESWTDMVAIWNRWNPDMGGYFTQLLVDDQAMAYFDGLPDADRARELYAELMSETDPAARQELSDELNYEVAEQVLVLIPAAKAEAIEVWDDTAVGGYESDPYTWRMHLKDAFLK
ncbi:ABC transporter substrate-binding protein [Microbacterium sp. NPDC079995]|uniref:ABC transporter substrate-binding protein n=1 Tax=unclassified Microbacterium TaxID=2609290 RepID=UPI00344EC359